MHSRSASVTLNLLVGGMVCLAVVVAVVAVVRMDTWGGRGGGRPESSNQDRRKPHAIDPALIRYEQTGEISVAMQRLSALAVGPDDQIYVGGDKAIEVFDPGGARRWQIALDGRPNCLAVGGTGHAFPGRVYVGMADRVELLDARGAPEGTWDGLGEKALITSIALAEQDVFVADAGNKIVLRYDATGKLQNRIGGRDDRRKIPGFRIPSPYFDVAVSPDGLLCAVNPLMRRVETYTFDGDMELEPWGKSSPMIEGFFGCCNPAHIAILPDGRFVTAEKGIPRVKVYDGAGRFVCVVAGPEQLAVKRDEVIADVAIDGQSRVLVLDPGAKRVRIFEEKPTMAGAAQ